MPDKKKKTTDIIEENVIGDLLEEVQVSDHSECELQLAEIEGKYKRALADYQNLERVTAENNRRFMKLATQSFVEDLVGPYDHLRLAAAHLKDKGLDLVMQQFRQVFEGQGLKEISPLGQSFDPMKMEVIETKEGKENEILEVASCGYELNGIVIQPAKVIVGKSK